MQEIYEFPNAHLKTIKNRLALPCGGRPQKRG